MNIDAKFLNKIWAHLDNWQSNEKDVSGSWPQGFTVGSPGTWPAPYLSGVRFLAWDWGWGPGDRDLVTFYWVSLGQVQLPAEGGQGGFLPSTSPGLCRAGSRQWNSRGASLQASCWVSVSQPKHGSFTNRKLPFLQQPLSWYPLHAEKVLFILHYCCSEKNVNK